MNFNLNPANSGHDDSRFFKRVKEIYNYEIPPEAKLCYPPQSTESKSESKGISNYHVSNYHAPIIEDRYGPMKIM